VQFGYFQCWAIVAMYSILLFLNIVYRPFYEHSDFVVEAIGQVLQVATCIVPIVCYHLAGGVPNERAGFMLMMFQIGGMMISVLFSLPPLIASFKHWYKSKTLSKAERERQRKIAKQVLKDFQRFHVERPPSFAKGVVVELAEKIGLKKKHDNTKKGLWDIDFVTPTSVDVLTPAQKRWAVIRALVISGEFSLIVPKAKPCTNIEETVKQKLNADGKAAKLFVEFEDVKVNPRRWVVVEDSAH